MRSRLAAAVVFAALTVKSVLSQGVNVCANKVVIPNNSYQGHLSAMVDENMVNDYARTSSGCNNFGDCLRIDSGFGAQIYTIDLGLVFEIRTVLNQVSKSTSTDYMYGMESYLWLSNDADSNSGTGILASKPDIYTHSFVADFPAGSKGRYLHMIYEEVVGF